MRIEQPKSVTEVLQPNNGKVAFSEKVQTAKAKGESNASVFVKDSTYLNPAREEKKTLVEKLEEETSLDATARKNQMAVLSHTTTEEDYAKMQEEGFSLDNTNGKTIVTVIDKIKVELSKAGKDISCFGDDLSTEELKQIAGSDALAIKIKQALKEADLPETEENLSNCSRTYEWAKELSTLSEGGIQYMLKNELPPTLSNLYKANYCGVSGYDSVMGEESFAGMQAQLEEVIKGAGLSVEQETTDACAWLLAKEIPLTPEHLTYYTQLKGIEGAIEEDVLLTAMTDAIAEGLEPKDGILLPEYRLRTRAEEALYIIENATEEDLAAVLAKEKEVSIATLKEASFVKTKEAAAFFEHPRFVTAKRQLEETRLWMSVEANYSLLKKGIAIDTKPLEELVEALKKEEQAYYESLFQAEGIPVETEKIEIFAEATEKLTVMKTVPAYVIGKTDAYIRSVYEDGTSMKAAFEKANQSYEPLLTAPRRDLGDSYAKAFGNIDALLEEAGLASTEENRRAVRILAYQQREITEESVLQTKAADLEVQRVFKNLTPHVVLEMLRKGENPLEMDFATINRVAEEILGEENAKDTEGFSKYLWKLEQKHEITEEERSAYIGIYRLIHQVEQTDGAAIGALLAQGQKLSLKNLLTAVRSGAKEHKLDVKIDDSIGELGAHGYKNSIIDQIMVGYQANCLKEAKDTLTPDKWTQLCNRNMDPMECTPEEFLEALREAPQEERQDAAYRREQLAQVQQVAVTTQEVYRMLEQYDLPNTVANIQAMQELMKDRNGVYKKLFQAKEKLLEAFANAASSPEEMAKAQETLAKVAEHAMKTVIEEDDVKAIDIREAKMMYTQMKLQGKMAEKDTYSIPVLIGDEVTNVTLKIVNGVERRGMVDIMLEGRSLGKIAATFTAKEKQITGTILTDRMETKELLSKQIETDAHIIKKPDETCHLEVVYMKDLKLEPFQMAPKEEAEEVSTRRLFQIAESFLHMVKEKDQ